MSVADFIHDAIDKMDNNNAKGALASVCIAIDATAKKEYPSEKKVGKRFKAFIQNNIALITRVASNVTIKKSLRLPNVFQNIPGLKDKTDSSIPFEDIIYHVVRCQLLHTAELPDEIKFIDRTIIHNDNGTLKISKAFIFSLIVVVVSAQSNKKEKSPPRFGIKYQSNVYNLDMLWGNAEKIRHIVGLREPPS